MKRLAVVLMLVTSVASADDVRFSAGVVVQASATLVADSTGTLQIDRSKPITIGGTTVTPGPGPVTPPPVPVPAGLLETLTNATRSIQLYDNKDEDAKTIAFTIAFVTPYLKGNAKVQDVTVLLKKMSDEAMGTNANRWNAWWTAFDKATKDMSIEQYKAALGVATQSLTADAGFTAGEFGGVESYGLDIEKLLRVLKFIMEYLPQILALFKTI